MLSRDRVREIRDLLQSAVDHDLHIVSEGIAVEFAQARYSRNVVTFQVNVSVPDGAGRRLTKEEDDFLRFCHTWDLQPETLGAEFEFGGTRYVIVGAKPRAHKYPILVRQLESGEVFRFDVRTVRACLAEVDGG